MKPTTIAAAAGFLGCIIAANYATTTWGLIPVGFGLVATAGTYFAGATFILRDVIQDGWGRLAVVGLILVGAALSWLVSAPFIALASGVAFLISELADLAVYTPLRQRGWVKASVASNIVGSFIDTVLFLAIAGFPLWSSVPGQMVGKLTVTLVTVAAVGVVRAIPRESVRA